MAILASSLPVTASILHSASLLDLRRSGILNAFCRSALTARVEPFRFSPHSLAGNSRPLYCGRKGCTIPHATGQSGSDSQASEFHLEDWVEARVETVRQTDKSGPVVFLKLLDGAGPVLPIYVGEAECTALVKEINSKHHVLSRPLTHDFMKSALDLLGYRVTKVRVHALVGNTYHARVHFNRGIDRRDLDTIDMDCDARPSDALNLAVRFGAPVYVHRDIAAKMARPMSVYEQREESQSEIARSCREEVMRYHDPTVMPKVHLQIAIAEERYDDAVCLQQKIDKLLASDRALSLVVAIETALSDGRYEEAAKLRDEFKVLQQTRALRQASEPQDA